MTVINCAGHLVKVQVKSSATGYNLAATPPGNTSTDGAVRTLTGRVFHSRTVRGKKDDPWSCVRLVMIWYLLGW